MLSADVPPSPNSFSAKVPHVTLLLAHICDCSPPFRATPLRWGVSLGAGGQHTDTIAPPYKVSEWLPTGLCLFAGFALAVWTSNLLGTTNLSVCFFEAIIQNQPLAE